MNLSRAQLKTKKEKSNGRRLRERRAAIKKRQLARGEKPMPIINPVPEPVKAKKVNWLRFLWNSRK
jgi:hypothetical protein